MRNYIIKRILLSILILFSVTFIIYAILRCLPASYVEDAKRQGKNIHAYLREKADRLFPG